MAVAPRVPDVGDLPELSEGLARRFEVEAVLGRGASGIVVRARDRELRRRVALKLLVPATGDLEPFRARFSREARLAARVRSPRVAEVFDFDAGSDPPYLVSRLVSGRTLLGHRLVRPDSRLPVTEAIGLALDLLEGLAALHEVGIVHRDVKPQNAMVEDSRAVVIDLGLGRSEGDMTVTRTGGLVGTPLYMPPEQMEGASMSVGFDLYAVGLVTLELLTGRNPLAAVTLPALHRQKQEGWTGTLAEDGVEASPGLEDLLRRCLDPEPGNRPGSALELGAALARLAPGPLAASHVGWMTNQETKGRVEAGAEGRGGPGAGLAGRAGTSQPIARIESADLASAVPGVGRPWARGRGRWSPRVRSLAALTGIAAGLVLLRVLAPGPGVHPPPSPPSEPPPAPGEALDRTLERLEQLVERIENDPGIVALVTSAPEAPLEQVRDRLARAQGAYRDIASSRGLAGLLARPPPPGGVVRHHTLVTRLGLLERILGESTLPRTAPLWQGTNPGVDARLASAVAVRRATGLEHLPTSPPPERRRSYLPWLESGVRRWVAIRSFESLVPADRPLLGPLDNLRVVQPRGEPYVSAYPESGVFLVEDLWGKDELERERRAPTEAVMELAGPHPRNRDLWLALILHGWGPTVHLRFDALGTGAETPFLFSPPPVDGPAKVGDMNVRQGFLLGLRADLVPEGLRELRLRLVGVQALGSPKATLEVEEIYQLVDGPDPGEDPVLGIRLEPSYPSSGSAEMPSRSSLR